MEGLSSTHRRPARRVRPGTTPSRSGTKSAASGRIIKHANVGIPDPTATAIASAKAAGLRYVTDAMAGIRRIKSGKSFRYVGPDGKPVRDAETLTRIRSLVVPPAWTDVWICPIENGHIQVTARDARGRKQYRYHRRWREVRDETKYEKLAAFGRALPLIRRKVDSDLALPGLPREKVLAAAVRLLESRSEEHTSELQSRRDLVCRLLLEKKKKGSNY